MWKFALHNLLSRKVRTALSLLGLTVSIIAMVSLFSVAEGLDAAFDDAFGRIPGLIAMQPGAPVPLFSAVPRAWGDEIRKMPGVRTVNDEVLQRANLIEGELITQKPRFLLGFDIPTRLQLEEEIYRDNVIRGRFLEESDDGTLNCVISKQIAEEYERDLGDRLGVNGFDLTIVGVYHTKSLLLDVAIILDDATVRGMTGFNPEMVSAFYIEPEPGRDKQALAKTIEDHFRGRTIAAPGSASNAFAKLMSFLGLDGGAAPDPMSSLVPDRPDDILPMEVKSTDDLSERVDEFSGDLDLFLFLLTSIGVTIAVLMIVNTMLMSVTERITEFGVLKANGWSRWDVLKLVTFESASIGFLGGVCGCLIGWIATLVVNEIFVDRLQLYASPQLLLFSLTFSTLVGVAGGAYPALWAMRLSPMEAIRRG